MNFNYASISHCTGLWEHFDLEGQLANKNVKHCTLHIWDLLNTFLNSWLKTASLRSGSQIYIVSDMSDYGCKCCFCLDLGPEAKRDMNETQTAERLTLLCFVKGQREYSGLPNNQTGHCKNTTLICRLVLAANPPCSNTPLWLANLTARDWNMADSEAHWLANNFLCRCPSWLVRSTTKRPWKKCIATWLVFLAHTHCLGSLCDVPFPCTLPFSIFWAL